MNDLLPAVTGVQGKTVCVAVPTYRRPELLMRTLEGLSAQAGVFRALMHVVVIDNDPEGSAEGIVAHASNAFKGSCVYAHVPGRGLANVRNYALRYSRDFDFLAMIDDDERPERIWLAELLRVIDDTHADAVFGPVPGRLPLDAPGWIKSGAFFEIPRFADGARLSDGYSGNCLLRTSSVRRLGVDFDARLNAAGGEDLLFFRQFAARGGVLVYAAKACAEEHVGRERACLSYIIRLSFRRGNSLAICDRIMHGTLAFSAVRALKACALIGGGMAKLLPLSITRGRAGAAAAACDVAKGFGEIAGLCGFTYAFYGAPARA